MSGTQTPWPLVCAALCLALVTACGEDAAADKADAAAIDAEPAHACAIGELKGNHFVAWPDGVDAELVVGYQGYLFVHIQVADPSGQLLKPSVRMTAERPGLAPSITSRWRIDMKKDDAGGRVSDKLELWLYPALREQFIGHKGTLRVELHERGTTCTAAVAIKYVDELLCMHYEDGSIKCKD